MATPSIVWKGSGTASLVEQPDSGQFNLAEKVTLTKIYEGTYALCLSSALARGTFGSGALAGYIVSSSNVVKVRGGKGRLTIVYESATADSGQPLPPDDFELRSFEINPNVRKNPRYQGFSSQDWKDIDVYLADPSQAYPATMPTSNNAEEMIKIVTKILAGQESYYLAGATYVYTFHSYTLPALSIGGFVESPGGTLSAALSADFDWLREMDQVRCTGANGSVYQITRTWRGAPAGHWDPDFYTL